MKKMLAITAFSIVLAGCNSGPDEISMTKAVEEAMGNYFAAQMQSAMLQGNLTRAMQGMSAVAAIKVGNVKKKTCEKIDKTFFCDVIVPITARNELKEVEANVMFWYDDKQNLLANVHNLMNAPAR